ncbi:unnamed protein product [Porites evermanni]|uniref:Reverse transcriptase zinc-binding domain-containing protein n=1 Tax=Porites evermanni TaxID=104178 RepID=A0ABN8S9S6_9CNID|nr:unnamed protein product [Porites evermanni]
MWTQTWPIANIQQLDREGRKIIVENGGNHPKGSTAILYMSRKLGGRGLKSVENEYKNTKIKAAVKLYCITDLTMAAVRSFEELAVQNGRHSIISQLLRYNQRYLRRDGKESLSRTDETTRKLNWRNALCGFLHGRMPQRISSLEFKSFTNNFTDEKCRLCGDSLENVQHILSSCSALAQTKYLQRHNNAFKKLFSLKNNMCPTYISTLFEQPAIKYEQRNHDFTIPRFNTVSFGKHSLRYMGPKIWSSVPSNVKKASTLSSFKYKIRKTILYTVLSNYRYPEYKVNQYNIIMDVLGGCSKEVEKNIKELLGDKCESIMRQMQKAILSSSLHIA